MLILSDLMVFRPRYYHESGVPSRSSYHKNSFQNCISSCSTIPQTWSSGCVKGFAGRLEKGNMQRVVSRHKHLIFSQFFPVGLQPTYAAQPYRSSRNFGFARNFALQSMDSCSLWPLIGNAKLLDPFVGGQGGTTAVRVSSNVPGSRRVIPRRSFRESRKLITRKTRQRSSRTRIESTEGFSAERLLEGAVDVLRNFNEKVTSLRYRWGGGTGSRDLSTTAEEKLPLSSDSAPIESTASDLGEVAKGSSGNPPGSEFEWQSALWEAEVSSVEELEAVSKRDLISVGTDGETSTFSGLDAPQISLSVVELQIGADERIEETAATTIVDRERELSKNGNVVSSNEVSDDASSVELEEVDIGDLWNRTSPGHISLGGVEAPISLEPPPESSPQKVDPPASEIERDGGRAVLQDQDGQHGVSEPSSILDYQPQGSRADLEIEIVIPSTTEIEKTDAAFSIQDEASQSSGSEAAVLAVEARSTHGNVKLKIIQSPSPQGVNKGNTQSLSEERTEQKADSEPSLVSELQAGSSFANVNGEAVESSAQEVGSADTKLNIQGQSGKRTDSEPGSVSELGRSASGNVQPNVFHPSAHQILDGVDALRIAEGGETSSVGGRVVSEESGPIIKQKGQAENAIKEETSQNKSSVESLSQDSLTAASVASLEAATASSFRGQPLTGEGSVITEERPVIPDREPVAEVSAEPFIKREKNDARIAAPTEKKIAADIAEWNSSVDEKTGGMDNQALRQDISRLRSDAAYDALVKELVELETQGTNSEPRETSLVGAQPSPEMLKVPHSVPMLSLASVQTEEEALSWYEKLQQKLGSLHETVGWVVEPKVDGLALSIRYEDGKLKWAATRGDGMEGEDVTHNAQSVQGIPLTIPHQLPETRNILTSLDIRGEIFMSLQDFKELNDLKIRSGVKPMANPRNAAAGSMRLLSANTDELRPLSFVAYSIANIEVAAVRKKKYAEKALQIPKNQWEALQLLKSIGFAVNEDNQYFESFETALEYAKSWRDTRESLEYEADGVVLKVNDLETQASLGSIGGDPRWAIAWKFAATEAVSVLEGIELTVGRSGAIIPNARFKPVELGGVTVSRASLHNLGHVKALGLHEGDHIVVQRAGDVIPQVVQVLEDLRPDTAKPWVPPQECPSCGSRLTEPSASAMIFCSNSTCQSRHSRQVAHFAKILISGLGAATLSILQEDLVKDPADFYDLDEKALSNLKGFGKASVSKLLKAIEESKHQELWQFIAALGIPRIGANTAKELAERFHSLEAVLKAELSDFKLVPGVGAATAACIFDWCQSEANIELVRRLEAAGCKLNENHVSETLAKPDIEEDGFESGLPSRNSSAIANESWGETDVMESKEDPEDITKSKIGGTDDLKSDEAPVMVTEQPTTPKLSGKSIVITGDFGTMRREDMRSLVTLHGGQVRKAVTSKTSFVLCGNRPGPSKLSDASRLGIEILDWERFLRLIGQTSSDFA